MSTPGGLRCRGVAAKDRIVGHEITIEDAVPGAPVAGDRQGEIAAHGSELFVGYADSADNEAVSFPDGPPLAGDQGFVMAVCFIRYAPTGDPYLEF